MGTIFAKNNKTIVWFKYYRNQRQNYKHIPYKRILPSNLPLHNHLNYHQDRQYITNPHPVIRKLNPNKAHSIFSLEQHSRIHTYRNPSYLPRRISKCCMSMLIWTPRYWPNSLPTLWVILNILYIVW